MGDGVQAVSVGVYLKLIKVRCPLWAESFPELEYRIKREGQLRPSMYHCFVTRIQLDRAPPTVTSQWLWPAAKVFSTELLQSVHLMRATEKCHTIPQTNASYTDNTAQNLNPASAAASTGVWGVTLELCFQTHQAFTLPFSCLCANALNTV